MAPIKAESFDHVALWIDERDRLADFLCAHLGMHVIERSDDFTLIGVDALLGKLTLFDAEGPREAGALERIALRVADLETAIAALPDELDVTDNGGVMAFDAPAGVTLALTEGKGTDYDLDHVRLRVPDVEATGRMLAELGFERDGDRLRVAERHLELVAGPAPPAERPLLNHLALLVDSAAAVKTEAAARELEIVKTVDAENTLAVFVEGPDGITVEYVEHKASFSLV
jgi:catechol 2,3-dioxygenase-like lactoylglutathione lyase family enzyme